MLSNRLVIGLDYGTTLTGVSFCETTDTEYVEDRIQIVQDWTSVISMIGTKEKVPSAVAYTAKGGRSFSLRTRRLAKLRGSESSLTINAEKRPVDIIADFLTGVKAKLIENLDRQYGTKLWRMLPITLVVTVPAVWSDTAKDRTLQAVKKAGFNTTELPRLKRTVTTTEPEAAAIYTI